MIKGLHAESDKLHLDREELEARIYNAEDRLRDVHKNYEKECKKRTDEKMDIMKEVSKVESEFEESITKIKRDEEKLNAFDGYFNQAHAGIQDKEKGDAEHIQAQYEYFN